MVFRAIGVLHSERNSPELPIPVSAIERYADRYGLSAIFVGLVRHYDNEVMRRQDQKMKEMRKHGGSVSKGKPNIKA